MAADMVFVYASEADKARDRIAATIDELQDRLSPRRIVGDAVGRVQIQGTEMLGQVRDAVKGHPLAIVAVGAAVGLALLGRSKLVHAKVNLGDDFDTYTDYDDGYASDAAPQTLTRPSSPQTQPRASRSDRIAANPLVSIMAGLAAGAVIGALIPATDGESKLLAGLRNP